MWKNPGQIGNGRVQNCSDAADIFNNIRTGHRIRHAARPFVADAMGIRNDSATSDVHKRRGTYRAHLQAQRADGRLCRSGNNLSVQNYLPQMQLRY